MTWLWIRAAPLAAALLIGGCAAGSGGDGADPAAAGLPLPMAIDRRVSEMAGRDLWPGFDPRGFPLAIHDGRRTWLFRHPIPPDEFVPFGGAHVMEGRHPAVTANTSAEIGGVMSAVLWEGALAASVEGAAATAVHEAFHAFQREHHPGWAANELDLFLYPMDNEELLGLRRLESEALRRALRADVVSLTACWARAALELRGRRFDGIPPGAAAYERGNELNEGLARYVERRAVDDPIPPWRFDDFAAEAVRARTYATGAAIASLLDRFDPAWRQRLEEDDTRVLDGMLDASLPRLPAEGPCRFEEWEWARARDQARREVGHIQRSREEARDAFLHQPGWRLDVDAIAAPFDARFDPMNLQVVGLGEIVHDRIVLLSGSAGTVEVTGRPALTVGVDSHRLLEGVGRVVVTGLEDPPEITEVARFVTVQAEGVRLELVGATTEAVGHTVTVRVHPRRAPMGFGREPGTEPRTEVAP